ncbi:MAG TPA: LuxR family transcriptional regulator [Gammaproteobacteria bacterium]|nr:LuxR family transcriptional regulator [Gammaproteobacteria bacterium]
MNETTEMLDLAGLIYESSYDASQWVSVLQNVAQLTDSSSAALLYRDDTYPRANFMYSYGLPPAALQTYLDRYIHLDPFFDLIGRRFPVGTVSADHLVASSREELREASPKFYDEYMIPYDQYHIGGAALLVEDDRMAAVAIQRSKALGSWTDKELEKLSLLTDHFRRAFRIHREFTRLRVHEYAVYAMLDQLIIGLVILDKNSKPIYTNPTAQSILNTNPTMKFRNGKITATNNEDAKKLAGLIKDAANYSDNIEEMRGGVLGLHHRDSPLPLLLLATPVTDLKVTYQAPLEGACVALFISDPERSQLISPDALIEMYKLTKAEAGVTVALANGLSLKEIANSKSVSTDTVRSQLKSIFKKTNTNSQTDLIRMLLSGLLGAVQV